MATIVNGNYQTNAAPRNSTTSDDSISFTQNVTSEFVNSGRAPSPQVPLESLGAQGTNIGANVMDQIGMERLFQEIDLDMLKYLNGSYDPMFATAPDATATFFPNWTGNVSDSQFS